jgi:pSer/pThr/pTyr-binding forkhead associated (FHA) protein
MSFLIQRVRGGALTLAEVAGDVLRIGRGTRAALRSDNPAVSLDHATIAHDAAGYALTDLGSITGTYVNGRPVETARLAKGDVVEIGDLRIEVQVAEAGKPFFARVTSTVAAAQAVEEEQEAAPEIAGPRGGVVTAPKVDYASAYRLQRPYLTKLSLVALLLIAAFAILAEITSAPQKQVIFMPGGVSSAHMRALDAGNQPIAKNCQACHDPFHGVTDAKCIACHTKEPHAPTQKAAPQCLSCHAEHRGAAKLSMMPDARCTSCHADLAAHDTRVIPSAARDPLPQGIPRSARNDTILHIATFDESHPDFERPPDTDTLKFNHKLHLQAKGIFNGEGRREVLQCVQCHKLVADKAGRWDPKPIAFATDCQRCHRLTFDARFPNAEVPHGGDPGIVYGFLGGIYSGDSSLAAKNPEEVRRIITSRPMTRSAGESAVVSAEHVIKAKCTTCHELQTIKGRLVATRPVMRTRWIEHARFSHSEPHRACESCHTGARQSTLTADVLMPRIANCADCHGPRDGKAASTCLTCHEYHERSRNSLTKISAAVVLPAARPVGPSLWSGGRPGMMGWIFLAAITVLLVIVLVPVAIALIRRISRRDEPPPAARPGRAAPPPMPDIPTAKVPVTSAQPAAAAPPPPPPATTDLTQAEFPAPAREGTEMVQWYGMLVCTSGPLEGKRFIVEEAGFYIGRDPALAQVVVPDTRVSKRHVRIVVKDGKVHAVDQDSTNGTFLGKAGGERVTDVQLRKGDTLILADNAATFTYQI